MKRLIAGVVVIGASLAGGVVAYRQVQSVKQAWHGLEAADREVAEQERQFLAESLRLLGQEQEFRNSIEQLQNFSGAITERQERFVWLSGNIISQLVSKGEGENMIKPLQAFLNRRSILVRRFDKRAEEYRAGCSEGMRARAARWLGACDSEIGRPIAVPPSPLSEVSDDKK